MRINWVALCKVPDLVYVLAAVFLTLLAGATTWLSDRS